jgi:hypothetical protein
VPRSLPRNLTLCELFKNAVSNRGVYIKLCHNKKR